MERATLEERPLRLSRRERLAAWYYTGPLGRLLAFLLDLGSLFVLGLNRGVRWLLRLPPA
jgi:hypothetical protein